jgi:hypothetical protein
VISSIFWDVMPCNLVEVHPPFSASKSKLSKKPARSRQQEGLCSLMFLQNIGELLPDYDITLKETELFIVTAVRTSNPTS